MARALDWGPGLRRCELWRGGAGPRGRGGRRVATWRRAAAGEDSRVEVLPRPVDEEGGARRGAVRRAVGGDAGAAGHLATSPGCCWAARCRRGELSLRAAIGASRWQHRMCLGDPLVAGAGAAGALERRRGTPLLAARGVAVRVATTGDRSAPLLALAAARRHRAAVAAWWRAAPAGARGAHARAREPQRPGAALRAWWWGQWRRRARSAAAGPPAHAAGGGGGALPPCSRALLDRGPDLDETAARGCCVPSDGERRRCRRLTARSPTARVAGRYASRGLADNVAAAGPRRSGHVASAPRYSGARQRLAAGAWARERARARRRCRAASRRDCGRGGRRRPTLPRRRGSAHVAGVVATAGAGRRGADDALRPCAPARCASRCWVVARRSAFFVARRGVRAASSGRFAGVIGGAVADGERAVWALRATARCRSWGVLGAAGCGGGGRSTPRCAVIRRGARPGGAGAWGRGGTLRASCSAER